MIFDTDVIIWALRGNEKAAVKIDAEYELHISAITYMELLKGARNRPEQTAIKRFIHDLGFELIPINANISHRAMIYMEEYALSSGIDLADALIAATATENNTILCTTNHKHYKVIPSLEIDIFRP